MSVSDAMTARVDVEDPAAFVQFRIEHHHDRLVHLVFDMPGRSMNVFSDSAIEELGRFAEWVRASDASGVVIRSGKASGFCAGADLGELGRAYSMIMAAAPERRTQLAYDHFFKFSRNIRALETCGKPVAVAIGGIALGGGCELAMGGHYRVLADTPKALLGLPESAVGLLPGGGGTQRLPRLVPIDQALSILLESGRLSGEAARAAGLVDALVPAGEEVAEAERWLLTSPEPIQPWDRATGLPAGEDAGPAIAAARRRVLSETLGHYPAPLAILDCLAQGIEQPIDRAIETEMSIFAQLIQRPEPRDMITTLFTGRMAHDRCTRSGGVPDDVTQAVAALGAVWHRQAAADPLAAAALAAAGFELPGITHPLPDDETVRHGYWFDRDPANEQKSITRRLLREIADATDRHAAALGQEGRLLADYLLVARSGFPAYLGGPFAFAANLRAA